MEKDIFSAPWFHERNIVKYGSNSPPPKKAVLGNRKNLSLSQTGGGNWGPNLLSPNVRYISHLPVNVWNISHVLSAISFSRLPLGLGDEVYLPSPICGHVF